MRSIPNSPVSTFAIDSLDLLSVIDEVMPERGTCARYLARLDVHHLPVPATDAEYRAMLDAEWEAGTIEEPATGPGCTWITDEGSF